MGRFVLDASVEDGVQILHVYHSARDVEALFGESKE
jgi:hypothetical protein